MATITVTRAQVEKLLGTGAAKHSAKTLARNIGGIIAKKLFNQKYKAVDLEKIAVNKHWDGKFIDMTFVQSADPQSTDATVAATADSIKRFFENPEANSDL